MSNTLQITGKLIIINETQTFSSGFCKREFVIETIEDKYPQQIKLEAIKERCDTFDNIPLGSILTVDFNIRGNEYQGKYYVNLQSWKVNIDERGTGEVPKPEDKPLTPAGGPVSSPGDFDDEDDIPFKNDQIQP